MRLKVLYVVASNMNHEIIPGVIAMNVYSDQANVSNMELTVMVLL